MGVMYRGRLGDSLSPWSNLHTRVYLSRECYPQSSKNGLTQSLPGFPTETPNALRHTDNPWTEMGSEATVIDKWCVIILCISVILLVLV